MESCWSALFLNHLTSTAPGTDAQPAAFECTVLCDILFPMWGVCFKGNGSGSSYWKPLCGWCRTIDWPQWKLLLNVKNLSITLDLISQLSSCTLQFESRRVNAIQSVVLVVCDWEQEPKQQSWGVVAPHLHPWTAAFWWWKQSALHAGLPLSAAYTHTPHCLPHTLHSVVFYS